MSLEHSPARNRAAYTVSEFCHAYRISRGKLYQLWAAGLGPRYINIGAGRKKDSRRITFEAAQDWEIEGERRAAGEAA
jgi:hypothetical protein